ncbi:hypothetical protein ASPBRDRAFT_502195 [Aspergillus brasiliensis CBS 101740]|uniref:Uncharacterized protein n=1 Tax=Aspergillus brasiliensis (strain CBS 101740 / IMI 381727 / IBT 21946) TaxID=767769 RepID=A0A1L9UNQ7_ASPBC|nr:hypothetical protein ASPBRDRAFT_502195 [Aspergillus brasiliensis CBS 101740]
MWVAGTMASNGVVLSGYPNGEKKQTSNMMRYNSDSRRYGSRQPRNCFPTPVCSRYRQFACLDWHLCHARLTHDPRLIRIYTSGNPHWASFDKWVSTGSGRYRCMPCASL